MEVRRFDPNSDYPKISKWWEGWKWPSIPLQFLPEIGLVVSNDNYDICAAWIYRTDSKLCMFEFFISDPKAKKECRKGAIKFLISAMEEEAKSHGYTAAFMSIRNQNLINKAKKQGFSYEETGMTNLTKVF